eukprot:TRINITY_DN2416_c0_g1_i11.p1 TRINITY_DN2416_c0_g1~~TRINITY_DN2416_c0_g1_i11.p1  ORF type:complete len:2801 (+),score=908.52 TRINITY_DN2416_c0_g1_i11:43-8445(+)
MSQKANLKDIHKSRSFCDRGQLVWFNSQTDSWIPAKILSIARDDSVRIRPLNSYSSEDSVSDETESEELEGAEDSSAITAQWKDIITIQSRTLPPEAEDMIAISHLNEASILHNVRVRHRKDAIYTYVGSILVSVNPYKRLEEMFSESSVLKYKGKPFGSLPPHIFAIAESCHHSMIKDKKNQSILISGETGAGKTEATKYIMRYLEKISGEHSPVEKQLMEAHPVLEAFGNSRTSSNDNSSRFGKFFQIYFNASGKICGAKINHYLLEKSRVVLQSEGERNYHVFYQLLAGADESEKKDFCLSSAENFNYLNQTGCLQIEGVDDGENFKTLKRALDVLKISGTSQSDLFRLLSACLHLGNISFQKTAKNGSAVVGNKDVLEISAMLLNCIEKDLEFNLCNRVISMASAARSMYSVPLKGEEAASNRDALVKLIYERIFEWLISHINGTLVPKNQIHFLGILDIFGFEVFESNSFEQLTINYANEKLQQFFNKHLFKMEQEEYLREKIPWTKIEFEDNQAVVDFIEKKPLGLLSLLDEESNFPNGSDRTFLEKLSQQNKTSKIFSKPLRTEGVFLIRHYAGDVWYETEGFLAKNRDTIYADLIALMQRSENSFVQNLFGEEKKSSALSPTPSPPNKFGGIPSKGLGAVPSKGLGGIPSKGLGGVGNSPFKGNAPFKQAGPTSTPQGKVQTKKATIGNQFKEQLRELMTVVSNTEPHFIRAIKPNTEKKADLFDSFNVLRQLKYAGLLEAIRVRSAGYSHRPNFQEFMESFQVLVDSKKRKPSNESDWKTRCVDLIRNLQLDSKDYQIGVTKVFLKDRLYKSLSLLRNVTLTESALVIQRYWKSWFYRRQYRAVKTLALSLQSALRSYLARKEWKNAKKEKLKQQREIRMQQEKEEAQLKLKKIEEENREKEKKRLEDERKEREEKQKRENEARMKLERDKKKEEEEKKERLRAAITAKNEAKQIEEEKKKMEEEKKKMEEEKRKVEEEKKKEQIVQKDSRSEEISDNSQGNVLSVPPSKPTEQVTSDEKPIQKRSSDIGTAIPAPEGLVIKKGEPQVKKVEEFRSELSKVVAKQVHSAVAVATRPSKVNTEEKKISTPITPGNQMKVLESITVPKEDPSTITLDKIGEEEEDIEHNNSDLTPPIPSQKGLPPKEKKEQKSLPATGSSPIETPKSSDYEKNYLLEKLREAEKELLKKRDELESEKIERMVEKRLHEQEKEKNQKEIDNIRESIENLKNEQDSVRLSVEANNNRPVQPTYYYPNQPMTAPFYQYPPMMGTPPVENIQVDPSKPLYPQLKNLLGDSERTTKGKEKESENFRKEDKKEENVREEENRSSRSSSSVEKEKPKEKVELGKKPVAMRSKEHYGLKLFTQSFAQMAPLSPPVQLPVLKSEMNSTSNSGISDGSSESVRSDGILSSSGVRDWRSYLVDSGATRDSSSSVSSVGESSYSSLEFLPLEATAPPSTLRRTFGRKNELAKFAKFEDETASSLHFEDSEKAPALVIPKGKGLVNDYAEQKTTPFSFETSEPEVPDLSLQEEKPPEISVEFDVTETKDEPEVGIEPEDINVETQDKTRKSLPFVKYSPVYYKFLEDVGPLRNLDEFDKEEKIENWEDLENSKKYDEITFIRIEQIPSKVDLKQLLKKIGQFPNVQVLILSGLNLQKRVSEITLDKLRYCDISRNSVTDLTPILDCFRRSPMLEVAVISPDNPANLKPNSKDRVIASCPNLKTLNGKSIDMEERMQAIITQGTKQQQQKKNVDFVRWDLNVALSEEENICSPLSSMRYWQPELIKKISFPNSKLECFHVGTLPQLEELNLSGNWISELLGSGIEQCQRLVRFDISNNRISSKKSLSVFPFTSGLCYLSIQNNRDPVTGKELSNYRDFLIYLTRNLKGTNRSTGLVELDGSPISMDERVNAVQIHGKKKSAALLHKWNLCLMDYYGHVQLRTPGFLSNIKHCRMPSMNLSMVDLRGFFSLEVLDLSGNNLIEVDGINELPNLRLLNLSGNSNLDLPTTLQSLKENVLLEQVSFAIDSDEKHVLYIKSKKYRQKVLVSLLMKNPKFTFLDNVLITPEERVDCLQHSPGYDKKDVEKFKFELSLLLNIVEPWDRDYHYSVISVGCQYDPSSVLSLRRMNGRDLCSSACDFSPFLSLQELNLSHNRITDIHNLGLEKLSNLKILDLSSNQIAISLKEMGSFLDGMKSLECVAVRDNPSMRSEVERKKLIGLMESMRQVDCRLKVIDTTVFIDERIEAWKSAGGNPEQAELLRYKAVMYQRTPTENYNPNQLTTLDLNDSGFQRVDVSEFKNLEILLLRKNKLVTSNETGITSLKKLTVLDLRDNRIERLEEAVDLVRSLTNLKTLGFGGNKCTEGKNWRQKLLVQLPELHEKHQELKMIDESEITVEEIVQAWKSSSASNKEESRNFRFQVLSLLKIPRSAFNDPSGLEELDFSNSGLSHVDLSKYPNLLQLSLAKNQLKSLEGSHVQDLLELRALDLSENALKDIDEVCGSLQNLKSLKILLLNGNPCFSVNDSENRIRFLSKMYQYFEPLNYPLKTLSGQKLTVQEKCAAMKRIKTYVQSVESIRLELAISELNAHPTDTYLDLSNFEFSSISGIHNKFSRLTQLNLSRNQIKNLEVETFRGLPHLTKLDLSNNAISGLKEILNALIHCKSLEILVLIHSTGNKETAIPREYAFKVCKELRSLSHVDGLKNPFGQGTVSKKKHLMRLDSTIKVASPGEISSVDTGEFPQISLQDSSSFKGSEILFEDIATIYQQQKVSRDSVQPNWMELYSQSESSTTNNQLDLLSKP